MMKANMGKQIASPPGKKTKKKGKPFKKGGKVC